jgi:hypothetical protein
MKIAVCISGETRNFNQVLSAGSRGPLNFVAELKKFFPTVDVYGHTWAHCELPDQNQLTLKKLRVDDQSIIDDWVKDDFVNRAFSLRQVWNNSNRLTNMDPNSYVRNYLQKSRESYGQIFSAFYCFALVPLDTYDIVIRFRWDLSHVGDENFFKKTVINRIKWLSQDPQQGKPCACGTSNSAISSGDPPFIEIEDTFFMFNKLGHRYICAASVENKLDCIFESRWGNEKSSAHTLWADAIFTSVPPMKSKFEVNENLVMFLHLPNMFRIIRLGNNIKSNDGDLNDSLDFYD